MRVIVLLCAICLSGCTRTILVRKEFGGENRTRNGLPFGFEDQEWISVSAFVITYPADERLISTRELRRDDRMPAFQQYSHVELETERSSSLTPARADEILRFARKRSSVRVMEMPHLFASVGRSASGGFGVPAAAKNATKPGFLVWLQPQDISHSKTTVKYKVSEFVIHYTSSPDQDETWEMTGEAELRLGECYLRATASNDHRFNVAVLLRLTSVSQPYRAQSDET